ncbi:MAG TPA: hypothetical protein PLK67_09135 [Bryobacteraceae bacterium]|nr:hypothetical protein [Bryobacteraceae bacterium]HOQ43839.1 hypothetical protein [Bryobacteraceae bacterium]
MSLVALAALVYLGWTMASRYFANRKFTSQAVKPAPPPPPDHGTNVKILHFYASQGELVEGGKAILCYGVANAEAVRLDPPVEDLRPSMNRCLEIAPQRDTRYTLTAEGPGGPVTESFLVRVKPDPESLPRITYFRVQQKKPAADVVGAPGAKWAYSLCFSTVNAVRITVDPPAMPPSGVMQGCFYAAPETTTTYTLTATDSKGHSTQKKLTVEVE